MSGPDLTTEVIGYRQWYVTADLKLRAAHKFTQEWAPGTNTAQCERMVDHPGGGWKAKPCKDTPGSDCECGFYALHDPSDFWYGRKDKNLWSSMLSTGWGNDDPLVSGIVVAWGKLEVHYEGFRAEHARVVALALPEGKRNAAVVRAVAAEYGVPCVPVDDLPKIAAEFGVTVPVEMRPEKPKPKTDELMVKFTQNFLTSTTAPPSTSWHTSPSYFTIDPGTFWIYGGAATQVAPATPNTGNPITKRPPANRQGPHKPKRPPKNLGGGGR